MAYFTYDTTKKYKRTRRPGSNSLCLCGGTSVVREYFFRLEAHLAEALAGLGDHFT